MYKYINKVDAINHQIHTLEKKSSRLIAAVSEIYVFSLDNIHKQVHRPPHRHLLLTLKLKISREKWLYNQVKSNNHTFTILLTIL